MEKGNEGMEKEEGKEKDRDKQREGEGGTGEREKEGGLVYCNEMTHRIKKIKSQHLY